MWGAHDHDQYSRSVYPGSHMSAQENIVFKNLVIQNDIACLVRSITPVDMMKISNSVISAKKKGNSSIHLETLPGWAECYPETQIPFQWNTCYGEPEKIMECGKRRACRIVTSGNLVVPDDISNLLKMAVSIKKGNKYRKAQVERD